MKHSKIECPTRPDKSPKNQPFLHGIKLALTDGMSIQTIPIENKKILIIDETRFSRICSAILEMFGYGIDIVNQAGEDLPARLDTKDLGLIITSYPYGAFLFDEIKKRNIPIIVLSNNLDGHLIRLLNTFNQSYCMVKPLDYDKFRSLVKDVISGSPNTAGGYSIL